MCIAILGQDTKHKQQSGNFPELGIREDFTYTDQDRLVTHLHAITFPGTGVPVELLSSNEYDALGKLKAKRVGGLTTDTQGLQKINYLYNIRGWLTNINNVENLSEVTTDPHP